MKKKNKIYSYNDERGLIYESYNIENISSSDCRSIFLDWLLGLNESLDPQEEIKNLYNFFHKKNINHPMTLILREGTNVIKKQKTKKRRKKN